MFNIYDWLHDGRRFFTAPCTDEALARHVQSSCNSDFNNVPLVVMQSGSGHLDKSGRCMFR